jgi:septal ring factor EnvC (AmiA/AmiB activator)
MVKNEEGKPVRIEGIIRDITERKRLEEELQSDIQELRKNLKAAEKENAELKKQLKSHGWIQK